MKSLNSGTARIAPPLALGHLLLAKPKVQGSKVTLLPHNDLAHLGFSQGNGSRNGRL